MREGKTRGNVRVKGPALNMHPTMPPPAPRPKAANFDAELLDKAMGLYLKDAAARREMAGHNGGWDDGGAFLMEEKLAAYKAGLARQLPKFLDSFYQEVAHAVDPEYAEYLRLHAKFQAKG